MKRLHTDYWIWYGFSVLMAIAGIVLVALGAPIEAVWLSWVPLAVSIFDLFLAHQDAKRSSHHPRG